VELREVRGRICTETWPATTATAKNMPTRAGAGWRLVAWVNADDKANLLASMAAIAEALGLSDEMEQDADAAGRLVRHWLEANGDRCMLVFDDAADPDALRAFIPSIGPARVLITSNRQSVANLGPSVLVEVFTPEEAQAFLAGRTGLADAEGAAATPTELGYLPLALAQAASLIAAQRLEYRTYLDRLRKFPVQEYLSRGEGQPYPHGVAEAILLSLDAVSADDQRGICTQVLEVMAVLSPIGVRRACCRPLGRRAPYPDADAAPARVRTWSTGR
jgi:hypothetical protein